MKMEVIVQNSQEAIQAEKFGADRLELVSAMREDGLTPSYGTMKQVLASVSIPVHVMIRPHNNHFFYEESDLEIMKEDIKKVIELGSTHIVFGALNEDYTINEQAIEDIVNTFPKLSITFHRAFDHVQSKQASYKILANYRENVKYILTTGGKKSCVEGKHILKELVALSQEINGPNIMPGTGLNKENIKHIHEFVRANDYHFGKGVRIDHSFAKGFDPNNIERIKRILKK